MASRRIKVEPGQRQVKVRGGNEGTPTETSLHTKRNTYRSSPRIGEEIKEESSTEEEFESHRTRRRFLDQSQATHRTPRPRQDSRSRIVPNIPGPQRQIIPPECPEPPNTSPTSSCASHVLVSMGNETVTPNVGGLRLQTPPRDYTQRQRLQRRRQMRHSEAVKEETGERDIREMDQAIQRRFARLSKWSNGMSHPAI